jgi:hypothetical protein
VIPSEYREFFTATAGVSGTLIGLLFVAITVAPHRAQDPETRVVFRSHSAGALLVFTNALVLSLAALVPLVSLGWWTLASCVGILAFALASGRSGVAEARRDGGSWRTLTLAAGLLGVAVFEAVAGIQLIMNGSDLAALRTLNYVVIADVAMGINRAWHLVSLHDTSLLSSLRVIVHGDGPQAAAEPAAENPE